MQTEADIVVEAAEKNLKALEFQADPVQLYGMTTRILGIGIKVVFEQACLLRRGGHSKNRAESLEMAYDFLLGKTTLQQWQRLGEIHCDREEMVVEALCHKKLPSRKSKLNLESEEMQE